MTCCAEASISATSSPRCRGSDAEHIYERIHACRGQAQNLIKQHKAQLASDRTEQLPGLFELRDSQQARNEGILCELIFLFHGLGCRRPISCDLRSALSQLWRPVRRDARQQSVSRSAWRRR